MYHKRILALDPGNSTGWVARGMPNYDLLGGTIIDRHICVWNLMESIKPEIVVYETFQMYPGKAQKLIWNTFYPCEVIGVIRLWCQLNEVPIIGLQPSVKKYALSPEEAKLWATIIPMDGEITEHTRDALRLLRYYERTQ